MKSKIKIILRWINHKQINLLNIVHVREIEELEWTKNYIDIKLCSFLGSWAKWLKTAWELENQDKIFWANQWGRQHGGKQAIFLVSELPSPPTTRGNPVCISDLSTVFWGETDFSTGFGGGLWCPLWVSGESTVRRPGGKVPKELVLRSQNLA